MDCWAAGLASFQRCTGIDAASSREMLVNRYSLCLSAPDGPADGSLPADCGVPVFSGEGCLLHTIANAEFDYAYVKSEMQKWGHLVVIRHSGNDVFHTLVVYGVGVDSAGVPNKDYFSVMNPNADSSAHAAGYQNLAFSSQDIRFVGHRSPPETQHVHPI